MSEPEEHLIDKKTLEEKIKKELEVRLKETPLTTDGSDVKVQELFKEANEEFNKGGDIRKVIGNYTKAISIDPGFSEAYNNRGLAHFSNGNYDESIADYTKAIELNAKFSKAYNNRGNAYVALKEHEMAIGDYTKAVIIDKNYVEALYNRGITYFEIGNYKNAIVDYTRVIELDEKYQEAYYNRGLCYENLKKFDKALYDFHMSVELDKKDAAALFHRGSVFKMLKEYVKACYDFSRAMKLDPKQFYSDLSKEVKSLSSLIKERSIGNGVIYEGQLDPETFDFTGLSKIIKVGKKSIKEKLLKKKMKKKSTLFFGNFKHGKRNGIGREFSEDGKLTFYGNFLDDKRSGAGIRVYDYYTNGSQFSGKGILLDSLTTEVLYIGKFKNGKFHGKGTSYINGEINKGKFFEGRFEGILLDLPNRELSIQCFGMWIEDNLDTTYKFPLLSEYHLDNFKKNVFYNMKKEKYRIQRDSLFSEVYLIDKIYNFKIFREIEKVDTTRLDQEFRSLCFLNHPNVVKFVGISLVKPLIGVVTESVQRSVYDLILENLKQRRESPRRSYINSEGERQVFLIPFREKVRILYKTAKGLEYLHLNGIIHRNLKWSSIFLTKEPAEEVKVTDFIISALQKSLIFKRGVNYFNNHGFIAPEICNSQFSQHSCTKASDVFAFAMMMYELLFELPIHFGFLGNLSGIALTTKMTLKKEDKSRPKIPEDMINLMTPKMISLMKDCWNINPAKRPTMSKVVERIYDYFSNFSEVGEGISKFVLKEVSVQVDSVEKETLNMISERNSQLKEEENRLEDLRNVIKGLEKEISSHKKRNELLQITISTLMCSNCKRNVHHYLSLPCEHCFCAECDLMGRCPKCNIKIEKKICLASGGSHLSLMHKSF